jgi:hypothetical protein
MKRKIDPFYAVLVAVAFVVLTAAGASRYVNGTEIPQAVTLLYSTGSQAAAFGAVTATTVTVSGAVGVSGALSVTGALGVTGAVTLKNASLSLTSLTAGGTASTTSAQGTVGASGLISTFAVQADTVGTNGDSYTLPSAAAGLTAFVCNGAAANNMDVFPFTSDSINKETADTAVNLLAGECMFCLAFTAVKWGCVIGAAN